LLYYECSNYGQIENSMCVSKIKAVFVNIN
jgi:hypothetical protein